MSLFVSQVFVLCGILPIITSVASESSCRVPVHYAQLGCSPVLRPEGGCPRSYDCDHLKRRSDVFCYFSGNEIPPDKTFPFPSNTTNPFPYGSTACNNCTCYSKAESRAKVATIKCNDCPPSETTSVPLTKAEADCTVDGIFYKEGDVVPRIDDSDCKKHFCRKTGVESVPLDCGFDLFAHYLIRNGCAPCYGARSCCPMRWICPDKHGTVIPAEQPAPDDILCTFGALVLRLGESLPYDELTRSNCRCDLPPMISCAVDEDIEHYSKRW